MSTDNDMKTFTLEQTAGKSVRFTGVQIATAGGRFQNGREQNRYTELTLWRTKGGKYVLMIDYTTQWQGESCSTRVIPCATPADVVAELTDEAGEIGRLDAELLRDAMTADQAFEAVAVQEVE